MSNLLLLYLKSIGTKSIANQIAKAAISHHFVYIRLSVVSNKRICINNLDVKKPIRVETPCAMFSLISSIHSKYLCLNEDVNYLRLRVHQVVIDFDASYSSILRDFICSLVAIGSKNEIIFSALITG